MNTRRIVGLIVAVIFVTTLISMSAFAQTTGRIEGKVIDAETGEALGGTKVAVEGTELSAAVDRGGRYSVSDIPAGKYKIVATMRGYEKTTKEVEVSADEVITVNFELEETALELRAVFISATKTERTFADIPVSAEVITREQMQVANIETVQDALRLLTGVDVRGTGGNIEILGLDGKYTMCLIDGVDNNSFAGAMSRSTNFAEMPTGMIERIEVVRGPASSLYGSEAVAGIVNVITRTAPRQPAYSVTSSFDSATSKVLKFSGEEQQRTLGFSGGQQIGNLGFFIGYNRRDAEARGVETDNYRANLQYEFSPAYKLTLKSGYYDEVLTKTRGGKAIETGYRKPSIALLWEMKPDEVSNLKLKGAYSYFTKESLTEFTDTEYEQNAQKGEGEILYTRPIGGSNLVTLGYNYKRESVNRPNYNVVGDQADHGLLIQDEIDFEPFFAPLTVVLGSRIDSYDSWGTHFIPSAAAIYKVSVPDLRFRASAGKAFKSPTVSQLYRDMWDHGGFLAVDGNPDLEPENSFGYQLGAEYRNKYLMTKVTFYDNDVTNKIDGYMTGKMHPLDPEKEVPIYSYRNVPEDHTRNITVDVFSRLSSYLTARLGYTCIIEADASEEGDDFLRVMDRPKHKMTLEPDFKVGALGINLRGEYIGKRWISGGRDEPDKKADGYSLAHAKFTLDVGKAIRHFYSGIPKTVTTRLSFAVNNIFDKKIEESGSGMMSGGGDTEGVGRRARLGVSIGMLMD